MHLFDVEGRRYAQFESLRHERGLTHAFSTRPFDVSVRDGKRVGQCAARRRQMLIDFGRDPEQLCCCEQVHESRVAVVSEARGAQWLKGIDAVATNAVGVSLMTFSADCPLVLVYDRVSAVVGLAHASWRCTVAMIVRRLIDTMQERFGCEPASSHAGIGPSAGPDCYEVGDDVYRAAAGLSERARLFERRGGRLYFDLWQANRAQLELAGIPRESIEIAGICTMSRTDLFYSYRREGVGCGHFCLLAGLNARAVDAG
jgi:YfiH family protein